MKISAATLPFCGGWVAAVFAFTGLCPSVFSQPESRPRDLSQMEAQARNGNADDKLELAMAYDLVAGAQRDPVRAAEWYRQAAALDSREAELRLGMFSEAGDGVPQSFALARQHYERALALGLPEANLRLGILYLEGWGVERDPAEAVARVQLAAEADYRPAQRVLSDMFAAGIGIKADRKEALAWAQRAARTADPHAQVSVGKLLMKRLGGAEDLKLAREWYQLSVEQKYTEGMLAMAKTFLRPGATAEDVALGREWLQLASDGGNAAAKYYLAGVLLLGPPPRNEVAAASLLEESARAGELGAREVVELAYGGRSLAEAFLLKINVPPEDRYVMRQNDRRRAAGQSDSDTRMPYATKITHPLYPAAMRLTGVTGTVIVEFIVDTSGRVRNPFVVTTPHPGFSDRALEAVSTWRFSPGMRNGEVVNTRMQVPIEFTLSETGSPSTKPIGPKKDATVESP